MTSYGVREATGGGEWILNTVSRNPEGLLLLGAGVALLMRSSRQSVTTSLGGWQYPGRREGMGERVGEAARRAGEYVSDTTDKVSETARSYASSAAEYADEATRAAAERSRRVADQARDTADYIVREQPWAVSLIGLLAGAAVATAFPPTRIERRTLGEVGERLRSTAGSIGEQVMEAGMQAGDRLGELAEERGLTSEGLKQAARDVGEAFSSSLSGEEGGRSAQGSNRRKPREVAGTRSQNRPTQGGGTPRATQAGESGGPQSSAKGGNPAPSGGQSGGPQSSGKGGNTAPTGGQSGGPQGKGGNTSPSGGRR